MRVKLPAENHLEPTLLFFTPSPTPRPHTDNRKTKPHSLTKNTSLLTRLERYTPKLATEAAACGIRASLGLTSTTTTSSPDSEN